MWGLGYDIHIYIYICLTIYTPSVWRSSLSVYEALLGFALRKCLKVGLLARNPPAGRGHREERACAPWGRSKARSS